MKNVDIDLSIIIKTLNEEKNIEGTIKAAMCAASGFNAEIIVADSASTDATISIAQNYPVTIVRLKKPEERSCGLGAQLGFQVARGRYVYLLDGDMQCVPGFINEAIAYLENNLDVAGVAGDLEELGDANNHEFQVRRAQLAASKNSNNAWYGEKDWLDGGGIYRVSALQQVRYVTNRNLHAYEEKELGLRLRAAGWRLLRLKCTAVHHFGHSDPTWSLLLKRWRTRYVDGGGDWLRSAWGKPYFKIALVQQKQYLILILLWLLTVISCALVWATTIPLLFTLTAWLFVMLTLMLKKGFYKGLFTLAYLNFWSAGIVRGVLNKQRDPSSLIDYDLLQQCSLVGK